MSATSRTPRCRNDGQDCCWSWRLGSPGPRHSSAEGRLVSVGPPCDGCGSAAHGAATGSRPASLWTSAAVSAVESHSRSYAVERWPPRTAPHPQHPSCHPLQHCHQRYHRHWWSAAAPRGHSQRRCQQRPPPGTRGLAATGRGSRGDGPPSPGLVRGGPPARGRGVGGRGALAAAG